MFAVRWRGDGEIREALLGLRFPLPPHPTPPPLRASLEKEVGERRRIVVASRGGVVDWWSLWRGMGGCTIGWSGAGLMVGGNLHA